MAGDGQRSARVEACLVQVAVKHLNALLIENNDLTENELIE